MRAICEIFSAEAHEEDVINLLIKVNISKYLATQTIRLCIRGA